MKLTLTKKELAQLGETTLKFGRLESVIEQELGTALTVDTLMKTDRELLDEMVEDIKKDIERVGGCVQETGFGDYVVTLPEDYIVAVASAQGKVLDIVAPFTIKAIKFVKKYKNTIEKMWCYIKAMSATFGPILERLEAKDIQKDFDALEEEFEKCKNSIDVTIEGEKALYELR